YKHITGRPATIPISASDEVTSDTDKHTNTHTHTCALTHPHPPHTPTHTHTHTHTNTHTPMMPQYINELGAAQYNGKRPQMTSPSHMHAHTCTPTIRHHCINVLC